EVEGELAQGAGGLVGEGEGGDGCGPSQRLEGELRLGRGEIEGGDVEVRPRPASWWCLDFPRVPGDQTQVGEIEVAVRDAVSLVLVDPAADRVGDRLERHPQPAQ